MEIERHEDITLYKFNWFEHMLVNAALKHVDRERRRGESDELPIHSAIRALAFDTFPENSDEAYSIRWILDDRETFLAANDRNVLDPSPEVLAQVMRHASNEIASGNHTACFQPIGHIPYSRYGYGATLKNHQEPLAVYDDKIQLMAQVLETK